MADMVHRIGIRAPIADVYQAIDGVAAWWTEEMSGESSEGKAMTVSFRKDGVEIGSMGFDVVRLIHDEEVRWRITAGQPEWIGTDVTFELAQQDEYTVLLFGHRNWTESVEFTAHCGMKWATFLLSLRELIETGKGRPAPHDLKIDNWN